jgi:hypothetical protein
MPGTNIDELAALLRYCEQFSQMMLAKAGEFHPFGAFVNSAGKIEALGAHTGSDNPPDQDVYALLESAVSSMRNDGKLSAYALAANVNIPQSLESHYPDGIRVHVESAGYSRLIYTPYKMLQYGALRRFLGFLPLVEYADAIAVDVPSKVFES